MTINVVEMKRAASELRNGERTWILNGHFQENQGFTIFPVRNEDVELYIDGAGISRTITEEEAIAFLRHENCTNKEALTALLKEIGAIA